MILTLEVVGERAEALGAAGRKVFDSIGGTIGRLPDNDWVLTDPYVSGRHALIRFLNGSFFIEDISTNGVFVNSPDHRIARAQPRRLEHGDVLYIDRYMIRVSIETPAQDRSHDDPFAMLTSRVQVGGGDHDVAPREPMDFAGMALSAAGIAGMNLPCSLPARSERSCAAPSKA